MALSEKIKLVWLRIPLDWRAEIVSAGNTFVSTLLLSIVLEISANNIPSSRDAVFALCATAFRAAWKATANAFILWLKNRKTV